MKTLKTLSKMILFAAVLAFVSCSKDDDNTYYPTASGDYYVKAKVNDAAYANSAYFAPTSTLNAGTLQIQSSNDSGNSIQMQVQDFDNVGVYNVGGDLTAGYVNYTTLTPFKAYTSVRGTGSIEVTEVTADYIKGTFQAIAPENDDDSTASVVITEGEFKVKR